MLRFQLAADYSSTEEASAVLLLEGNPKEMEHKSGMIMVKSETKHARGNV